MAEHTTELVLIGGGNMGSALLGGLVAGGWDPKGIVVVELDATKRADLESRFGVRTSAEITSGNLCANNGGPVSTSICDSLKTAKSQSDMTTVLAGIGSIYVRDNFCRWIFGYMDKGVSFTDAGNLCAQVNAKS